MKLKQKYKLQNYLFKSFLIIILTLILSFFITFYFYKCYIKEINIYTINVLDKVTNKYPLVNPNDILNYDHNIDPHIINKYGVTSNQSLLKEINNIALKNYIIIVIFTLSISLIKTLKKVNHNIYDLELDLEEEGTFAILKEEIYKHTKMLKELSLKNIDDKQNLKNTLANISHQIKTPLTSISILVDNLMNENIEDILFVGLGSGIIINQYEKIFKKLKKIDIVDIEENSLEIAQKYFNFKQSKRSKYRCYFREYNYCRLL